MGLQIDDPSITAFIAVIQVGAIAALVLYLRRDIVRLLTAWVRGLRHAEGNRSDPSYREAWLVILGSLPIAIVGLLAKNIIEGPLRSLWVVAIALIAWGVVMLVAEAMAATAARAGPRPEGRADHRLHAGAGPDPRGVPVREPPSRPVCCSAWTG